MGSRRIKGHHQIATNHRLFLFISPGDIGGIFRAQQEQALLAVPVVAQRTGLGEDLAYYHYHQSEGIVSLGEGHNGTEHLYTYRWLGLHSEMAYYYPDTAVWSRQWSTCVCTPDLKVICAFQIRMGQYQWLRGHLFPAVDDQRAFCEQTDMQEPYSQEASTRRAMMLVPEVSGSG